MTLKVTWIAPLVPDLPELGWLTEMARMKKIPGVDVTTLEGPIYLDEVANALLNPADLVVWSGHAGEDGLIVSDSSSLPTDWIVAHVRQCGPRAIILAACGTQARHDGLDSLAEAICMSGINAIGFPALADDKTAADFTVEFTRTMSLQGESGKVGNAFRVAMGFIRKRSGRGSNGSSTADGVFLSPGLRDTPFEIEKELVLIDERLQHIEKSLLIRYDPAPESTDPVRVRAPLPPSGLRAVTRGNIHKIMGSKDDAAVTRDVAEAVAVAPLTDASNLSDVAARSADVASLAGRVAVLADDVAKEIDKLSTPAKE